MTNFTLGDIDAVAGIISGIIAFVALIFSISANRASNKALSLSLFKNRYRIYHEIRTIVSQLEADNTKYMAEIMPRLKLISWEAEYLFGRDVCGLLCCIIERCAKIQTAYLLGDEFAACRSNLEDIEVAEKLYRESAPALQGLLCELTGEQKEKNLRSYFDKYLKDDAFRMPL